MGAAHMLSTMPAAKKIHGKKLYSIGLTAQLVGRCIATLRRWDMEGLFLARRDKHGRRVYNDSDLNELRAIAAALKTRRPLKHKPENGLNG